MQHEYWAVQWRQKNRLDGERSWFLTDWRAASNGPVLFPTRAEARAWRDGNYGYIRNRPDLKAEPHGWKYPRVVRVRMTIEEILT